MSLFSKFTLAKMKLRKMLLLSTLTTLVSVSQYTSAKKKLVQTKKERNVHASLFEKKALKEGSGQITDKHQSHVIILVIQYYYLFLDSNGISEPVSSSRLMMLMINLDD